MDNAIGTPEAGFFQKILLFGLLALIASLGATQIQLPLLGRQMVATDLIFLAVAAAWLVSLLTGESRLRWSMYYVFLAAYLLSLLISCIFSVDAEASFTKIPAEVYLGGLSVLLFNIVDDQNKLRRSMFAWLAGSAFAVCLGVATIFLYYLSPQNRLLEFLTYHYGAVPVGNYPRITATFVSASMFCNYLNVSAALTIGAKAKKWIGESTAWMLIAGIFACSIFTISVGLGGIFLAIALAVFTYRSSRSAVRWAAACCLLAAIGFLFLSVFALSPDPGAEALLSVPILNVQLMPSSRWLVWSDALRNFFANPITGVGIGRPTAEVLFLNTEGTQSLLLDAHNSFLNVATESGIIGLVTFLAFVACLIRIAAKAFKDAHGSAVTKAAGIGFICAFLYQGLTGSFEEARHLWVLIGLLLAAGGVEAADS